MKIFDYIEDLTLTETQLNIMTLKILRDLSTLSNEDILYYFSEFTDECEWEYESNIGVDTNQIVRSSFQNGGIVNRIFFTKKFNNTESKFDIFINAVDDIKKLKRCLEIAKNFKDEVIFVNNDVDIKSDKIVLSIECIKVVPDIEKIKAGYEKMLNKIKPKIKESRHGRYDGRYDMPYTIYDLYRHAYQNYDGNI